MEWGSCSGRYYTSVGVDMDGRRPKLMYTNDDEVSACQNSGICARVPL